MTTATPVARARPAAPRPSLVRAVAREHGLWAAIVLTHLVIGIVATLAGWLPLRRPATWESSYLGLFGLTLYWPVCLVAVHRLRGSEWRTAIRRVRADLSLSRLAGVLVGAVLVIVGFRVHDAWKSTVGRLEPYTWDPIFSDADRLLHFGRLPWQWLQPLFTPAGTDRLDSFYISWYPLLMVGIVWQLWNADRRARTQFFVAFALAWVLLGTVLAHLLASAGPVFYGATVEGSNPYLPLTEYLWHVHQEAPLTAVVLQHVIWENYTAQAHQLWMGMSAMPSLHVAMPALFACATWRVSRGLGAAVWGYTLLTVIGSVHLGWHYAVDGYLSLLGVPMLWHLSGVMTRRP